MRCVTLHHETDLDHWRETIRPLLAARLPSRELGWRVGQNKTDLFSDISEAHLYNLENQPKYPVRISKSLLDICRRVLCHRAPERLYHLYGLMLRLQTDPFALDDPTFTSGTWVREADKSVRRDVHKMHAFVRFKKVGERSHGETSREVFCAWFEPDHRIVEYTADFFARRFTGMAWSILTPEGCSHWDGQQLSFSSGVDKSAAPEADITEDAWKAYYSSIFNPARVKIGAMMAEMPKKYWKNLPEAELIPKLLQQSEARRSQFIASPVTRPNIRTTKVAPDVYALRQTPTTITSLEDAAAAATRCTNCSLHSCATQTVFGQGPINANLMLVGEQPGDNEDIAGRPLVGPAGQLLNQALNEAGLDRGGLYVTNAVKHFKFEARGKNRLHRTPTADEIERCKSWLNIERQLVKPRVILTLGKTALRAVTGHIGTLKSVRGKIMKTDENESVLATLHPSFLLRIPSEERREIEYQRFIHELRQAKALAEELTLQNRSTAQIEHHLL